MASKAHKTVRAPRTERPIMVLLDLLGQRWTLRILWELHRERLTFRQLRSRCDDVSPSLLNRRLKALSEARLVDHDTTGYGHTSLGRELARQLLRLSAWSERWAAEIGD